MNLNTSFDICVGTCEAASLYSSENVASTICDAIKNGLAAAVSNNENDDSVLQATVQKTEVLWYLDQLYSKDQIKNIDKKVLVPLVFEKLVTERVVHIVKKGDYIVKGEEVAVEGKVTNIRMSAQLKKKSRTTND